MKYQSFALVICLCSTLVAHGQSFVRDKGYFSVQTHPVYPFLGGYSVKGFYNLPKQWSFGLQVEGISQLPEFAQSQFFTNADNVDINWDYAVGAEVRYRFNRKDNDIRGFYVLATAGYEGWTVRPAENQPTRPNTLSRDSFTNWFASVGAGYNWFPSRKSGFYVGGSYGWILLLNNTQGRSVNGQTYNLRPSVPPSLTPNIYVGWRFGRSVK